MASFEVLNANNKSTLTKRAGLSAAVNIRGDSADQTGSMADGFSFVHELMGTAKASKPCRAIEQVSVIKGGMICHTS